MKAIAILVVLAGCAHDVRTRYPARADEPTGTLILSMADAASGVSVSINGRLVVDDAHTSHITIDRVPIGTREVVMAANGSDKAFNVWIDSEHATTVPLGVPDAGSGFLKSLAGSIITIVLYSLLR